MRAVFGQFKEATPEYLRFAAQFGATDILLNTPNLPGAGGRWELHDLVKLRLSIEQHGMTLAALENVPANFYDQIMLDGPIEEATLAKIKSGNEHIIAVTQARAHD